MKEKILMFGLLIIMSVAAVQATFFYDCTNGACKQADVLFKGKGYSLPDEIPQTGQFLKVANETDLVWALPPMMNDTGTNITGIANVTYKRLQRLINNSNETLYVRVVDLEYVFDANSNYTFSCELLSYSAAATTGEQLRLNTSGTPSKVTISYLTQVSATTRTAFQGTSTTSNAFADTGSAGTNVRDVAVVKGFIQTGANPSTLTWEMKTEIAASMANIDIGSTCIYYKEG